MKKYLLILPLLTCACLPNALDKDSDGVPDPRDLCADSRGAVDLNGCDSEQVAGADFIDPSMDGVDLDGDGVIRPTEVLLNNPPEKGAVRGGFYPIVLDERHIFHVHESAVTERGEEIMVKGDVVLSSPGGFIWMPNADLVFTQSEERSSVTGVASIPLPSFGLLDGFSVSASAQAVVGFAEGESLESLDAPLQGDRDYLYFALFTRAEMWAGDSTFTKLGPGALVVVDPIAPFVFLRGDLIGLGALGPVENVGVGVSFQGGIPFTPLVEPDAFEPMTGNLFLEGVVPLATLPVVVEGDTVIQVDEPLEFSSEVFLSANGILNLELSFLGLMSFDVELARATMQASLDGINDAAVYRSRSGSEPVESSAFGGRFEEFEGQLGVEPFAQGSGDFVLSGRWLTVAAGRPLLNIPLSRADFFGDKDFVTIEGPASVALDFLGVQAASGMSVSATFATDLSTFEVVLRGQASVNGRDVVDTRVTITPEGVEID